MGKFTFHPVQSLQSDPKLRMLCLFGIEGFLLQYAVSLYSLANNLYATNLGATDTQIGLVQMVPNMVAGICMIPVGFLANRTKTSRTVPFVLALFLSAAYFVNESMASRTVSASSGRYGASVEPMLRRVTAHSMPRITFGSSTGASEPFENGMRAFKSVLAG